MMDIDNYLFRVDQAAERQYKITRAWQDSNLQSPDPKSGALSIRPHTLYTSKREIAIKTENLL